ncbi:MAG: hypothetical protein QXW83_01695 [Nitrososphaerales archaeon]
MPFFKRALKDIPAYIYPKLIVEFGLTHEYAQTLKYIEQDTVIEGRKGKLFRIIDPKVIPKDIVLKEYKDLDNHPEWIIFEGFTLEPTTREDRYIEIKKKQP